MNFKTRRLQTLAFLAKEGPTSTAVLKIAIGVAQSAKDFDHQLSAMQHAGDIEKVTLPHDGTANNSGRLGRWEITEQGRAVLNEQTKNMSELDSRS